MTTTKQRIRMRVIALDLGTHREAAVVVSESDGPTFPVYRTTRLIAPRSAIDLEFLPVGDGSRAKDWAVVEGRHVRRYKERSRSKPYPVSEEHDDPERAAAAFAESFDQKHPEEYRRRHPRGLTVYVLDATRREGVSNCRHCGDPVQWMRTKRGRKLGLDVRSAIERSDGQTTMVAHWQPRVCRGGKR